MPQIPDDLRKDLFGRPWGDLFPPRAPPPPIAIDGRTAALNVLKRYVTNLTFFRLMGPGVPPKPFRVDPKDFHIEWPDYTGDMVTPSIAVVHSRASYDVIGLVSYIEEDTLDLFGRGTALQWQAEYIETINLEIWASKSTERRSILAGMETAFSPTEQMSGVRFRMPEYYEELVCFTLNKREVIDEPDSAKNRRRAQLELQMRFNIVALVNVTTMQPVVKVNVDVDKDTGLNLDFSGAPPDQLAGDLADQVDQQNELSQPNPLFVPSQTSFDQDR